jgi:uncharacterized protein HemX
MKNSTIKLIAGIAFVLIIGGNVVSVVLNLRNNRKTEERIQKIEIRKVKIINTDSIRSLIESRILDSLNKKADRQDAKIAALTKSLKVTRRQNEALQTRLDSIHVFMPDF